MNEWLDTLSQLISQSGWFAPLIALFAGVLTSFTPCALANVPLVISYVSGIGNHDTRKAFKLSVAFSLGMTVTLTILGTLASLLGKLMQMSGSWWYLLLGILMVLMALQTWELYNFIPSTYLISKSTKKGCIGAFMAGILGGIFSSPCATPVLVVLLALVAKGGNIVWGIVLLLLYSLGHSFLVLIAGTSISFVENIIRNKKYGQVSQVLKIVTGLIILLIGFYMFYLSF